jgi:hypothetical protein
LLSPVTVPVVPFGARNRTSLPWLDCDRFAWSTLAVGEIPNWARGDQDSRPWVHQVQGPKRELTVGNPPAWEPPAGTTVPIGARWTGRWRRERNGSTVPPWRSIRRSLLPTHCHVILHREFISARVAFLSHWVSAPPTSHPRIPGVVSSSALPRCLQTHHSKSIPSRSCSKPIDRVRRLVDRAPGSPVGDHLACRTIDRIAHSVT